MKSRFDIAVIGAGPAGMAAAVTASDAGASVVLLDEQPSSGGQIYRAVTLQTLTDRSILGPEYYHGAELAARVAASSVDHLTGATVWQVSRDRQIGLSWGGHAHIISAGQIIIATGAIERPFPVPGWTLPGVMGAGAAQILLKSGGAALPDAVFVGTGPLLYLVAHQYLQAGVAIRAVLDTTPRGNLIRALPHLPGALGKAADLIKGRRWIAQIRKAGVPFVRGVRDVRCEGDDTVRGVAYRKGGRWSRLQTQTVFLHQGIVPNTNLAVAAGCNHIWSQDQLCWQAQINQWGESNIPGIFIAGDGAAINGALAAWHSGRIAAIGALAGVGFIDAATRDAETAAARRALAGETRARRFLDAAFRPLDGMRIPADDSTIVCRCEEVTAGEIRAAVAAGCGNPNQLKSHTRCAMGPCQGRFCGLTATEIIAQERAQSVPQTGILRQRPVVKPLPLGQLAAMTCQPSEQVWDHGRNI